MADSMFSVDDKVQAAVNAQGLIKGNVYTIIKVTRHDYGIFGVAFVYTVVSENGIEREVVNGHLMLSKA
jgi:hypothetical protein